MDHSLFNQYNLEEIKREEERYELLLRSARDDQVLISISLSFCQFSWFYYNDNFGVSTAFLNIVSLLFHLHRLWCPTSLSP